MLAAQPRLLAVLVEPNEPGNLGTIVRTADAAGADAVVVDGGVDPYNGKAVRASAGSLFHLPVRDDRGRRPAAGLTAAGVLTLAASGAGSADLDDLADDGTLVAAHGLVVRRRGTRLAAGGPRRGGAHRPGTDPRRAESLNLAAAAAVCLYASARAQRLVPPG